jgi:hypothetical protein
MRLRDHPAQDGGEAWGLMAGLKACPSGSAEVRGDLREDRQRQGCRFFVSAGLEVEGPKGGSFVEVAPRGGCGTTPLRMFLGVGAVNVRAEARTYPRSNGNSSSGPVEFCSPTHRDETAMNGAPGR